MPPLAEAHADGDGDADETLPELETRALDLPVNVHGERLDRTLAGLIPEFSRNYLRQLIEAGSVQINGAACTKPARTVRAGDRVTVELRATPQSQAFLPQPMALRTVYEDEHLRVLDKPVGLVVHPAPGNWTGTLLNGLLALDRTAADLPRAGIVHRLDKDTSGLMVVARSRLAMEALVRQIAARAVSREYLALGDREWDGSEVCVVSEAIGRDPRNRVRMAVLDAERPGAKPARTTMHHLASAHGVCLVRCVLDTGRTHQIRVHMAHIRHPLAGDAIYGGVIGRAGMVRQALHAYRLAFEHPITGTALEFLSQPPSDFATALRENDLQYNLPAGLMTGAPATPAP